ncbi:DUF397 domain-containing protein [Streptomyces sp. ISL-111]|uniref:DUF397 domain-containing protein n=1 Tax=Streptomyces sp. ISL-111 TaxID=2819175 RepID=UPI001BE8D83F|nr:DUF397 domain-containing protein [Streptomyces sp. ISL-111]MBT2381428.1 DUF397 domain-containing protein [Streptomyces sp. ISL-111]
MTEAINWQMSSFLGPDDNQSCIEPAPVDGLTKLRESDDPRVVVTISPTKLRAFLLGVKGLTTDLTAQPLSGECVGHVTARLVRWRSGSLW